MQIFDTITLFQIRIGEKDRKKVEATLLYSEVYVYEEEVSNKIQGCSRKNGYVYCGNVYMRCYAI